MAISHHAFSLVVLQYHHVDASTPSITSVTPEQFAQHMALLEEEKMVVVDLEDVTHAILNGETIPDRAVAITFDDAYQSILESTEHTTHDDHHHAHDVSNEYNLQRILISMDRLSLQHRPTPAIDTPRLRHQHALPPLTSIEK
jgi:hypothetical protein